MCARKYQESTCRPADLQLFFFFFRLYMIHELRFAVFFSVFSTSRVAIITQLHFFFLRSFISDVIKGRSWKIFLFFCNESLWRHRQRRKEQFKHSEDVKKQNARKMISLRVARRWMTHPFGVEYGDLFSSIDNFVAADALAADEEVAPTTFWAALFRRPIFSVCRCPNVMDFLYRCQFERF